MDSCAHVLERDSILHFLDDDCNLKGTPANLHGELGVLHVHSTSLFEVKRDVREMIRFGMSTFGSLKSCLLIVECFGRSELPETSTTDLVDPLLEWIQSSFEVGHTEFCISNDPTHNFALRFAADFAKKVKIADAEKRLITSCEVHFVTRSRHEFREWKKEAENSTISLLTRDPLFNMVYQRALLGDGDNRGLATAGSSSPSPANSSSSSSSDSFSSFQYWLDKFDVQRHQASVLGRRKKRKHLLNTVGSSAADSANSSIISYDDDEGNKGEKHKQELRVSARTNKIMNMLVLVLACSILLYFWYRAKDPRRIVSSKPVRLFN